MKNRTILGVMSGTSVDAIDLAAVEIAGLAPDLLVKRVRWRQSPWPAELRKRLLAAMAPATVPVAEICLLQVCVAQQTAHAVQEALRSLRLPRGQVAAIASHGQTVCHLPPRPGRRGPRSPGVAHSGTLQLGDVSVIAALTGITTVGNFRPADMALGGHGAPLVPWADNIMFRAAGRYRAVQNIGGIANVTLLPPRGSDAPIIAFDTGPGNMLIDGLLQAASRGTVSYDRGGAVARSGTVDQRMLKTLAKDPYFALPTPKSTGRERFGRPLAMRMLKKFGRHRLPDALATATELTAWSIAQSYRQHLPCVPDDIVLCGGGARNGFLTERLAAHLTMATGRDIPLLAPESFGIPNAAREAAAFALLAAATLDGQPSNVCSVTGASRPAILGVIARTR